MIFGEDTPKAGSWFERRRETLLLEDSGVDNPPRALERHARVLPAGSGSGAVACRAIEHITKNRARMKYRAFIAMGLPIGSGHIESAAKQHHRSPARAQRQALDPEGGQRVLNWCTRVNDGRWDAASLENLHQRAA